MQKRVKFLWRPCSNLLKTRQRKSDAVVGQEVQSLNVCGEEDHC